MGHEFRYEFLRLEGKVTMKKILLNRSVQSHQYVFLHM